MRISLIQMDMKAGEVAKNRQMVEKLLGRARDNRADVAVLPELWSTSYIWLQGDEYEGERDISALAEELENGPTGRFLGEQARQKDLWLVAGTMPELQGEDVYNTCAVFDPEGQLVHTYRKTHLIDLMQEPEHFTAGRQCSTFDINGVTAGAIICYDVRFPELARSLAVQGAKIIFIPAQWPQPRIGHWETLIRARALENQCFVIGCNRLGESGNDIFVGHSLAVGPQGETLALAGPDCTFVTVDIDLERVQRARQFMPLLSDRREDVY